MKGALPLSTSGAGVFRAAVAGVQAAAAGRWSGKGGPVKKCQEKQKKITRKKNSKKKTHWLQKSKVGRGGYEGLHGKSPGSTERDEKDGQFDRARPDWRATFPTTPKDLYCSEAPAFQHTVGTKLCCTDLRNAIVKHFTLEKSVTQKGPITTGNHNLSPHGHGTRTSPHAQHNETCTYILKRKIRGSTSLHDLSE